MEKKTILLVEDEAIIGMAEAATLKKEGYEVIFASKAEKAVSLVKSREHQIDLILMDIDMGKGMDGTQAAQEILKEYDIPVVFLSGHTEKEIVEKTENITSYGYVVKNSGDTVLFASIRMAFRLFEAHRRLQESEERYRSFVENFHGIAYRGNMDFSIVFFQGVVETILGYTEDEFTSGKLKWNQLIHPEDLSTIFDAREMKLRTVPGFCYERDYRIIRKDGQVRWIHEVIKNICNKQGQPVMVQGVIYDITDRKEAEEQLREGESKYHQLFDLISDALLLIDDETNRILEVNRAAQELYGFSREELLQLRNAALSAQPDDTRGVTLEGRTRVPIRWHRRKDNTVFPVEIAARHFNWRGNKVHIAAIRDITERHRVEEERRAFAGKMNTLLNNLPGFIYRCRNEQGWTMEFISDGFEELTGYRADDFIGKHGRSFNSIIDTEDRQMKWNKVQEALDFSRFYILEYRIRTSDGSVRWVWEKGIGLSDAEGKIVALEGLITDITERKRAEEGLRRTNRALKMISECNQILVRAQNEESLLNDVCDVIISVGGYRLTWIGYVEQDERRMVRPVAQRGFVEGYLDALNIKWADDEQGCGPTCTAIRTGQTIIAKDIQTDPNFTPWREDALRYGFTSFIALPLHEGGRTFGTLNICASEPDAFNADEVKLLEQLATDLTFGILALRTRAAHDQVLKDLRHSERNLAEAQRLAHLGSFERDILNNNLYWSEEIFRIFGISRHEFGGTLDAFYAFVHPNDREIVRQAVDQAVVTESVADFEHRIIRPDGSLRVLHERIEPVFDQSGRHVHNIGMVQDVTDQRQTEEDLKRTLAEKDLLMKELQHRVKNNLSLISSLLSLGSQKLTEKASKKVFADSQNRIRTMTAIYERLSRSGGVAAIDVGSYIHELTQSLFDIFDIDTNRIKLKIRCEEIHLDIKHAVPLGLILNELVSNALKYAFPGKRRGHIAVSLLRGEDAIVLRVKDTGVGLSKDFKLEDVPSMGLNLVMLLIRQLEGEFNLLSGKGAGFEVRLPVEKISIV